MEEQYVEKNDMYKVGVKVLSDIQLKNILPTYENLFDKIRVCRSVADESLNVKRSENKKRHYQYNFMYDNVFSVLGKRGTGKTSVAFTLQKKIEEEEHSEYDVVLPLIIPEVIPENCTVLGWILAIVKEEMESLEEKIHEEERKSGGEQNRSRYRYSGERASEKSLVAKLDEISQMFFAGSYNPSNEESYYRAIGYSVQQAEDYYRFAKEIADLWDRWIDRIREYYVLKEGKRDGQMICPMIYFIFDDVDLAPEKIDELLSVIIKYLSHPNIIVITTADERLFLEVIEKQLDRKIGRIPGEWRGYLNHRWSYPYPGADIEEKRRKKDFEDVVNQTAAMYLGKVLPPSTRYYLRMFQTAKQKESFYVRDGETLGNAISGQICELIKCIDGKNSNFMMVNNTLINFYLNFIGETSRQISNVYIVLSELIHSLKKITVNMKKNNRNIDNAYIEEQINELYQECRYFLRVTLNSNHSLSRTIENIDEFVDEVFLTEYNQWRLYINYIYINEYVEDHAVIENGSEEEDRAVKVEVALQLYSLFAFTENVLLLMEDVFPKGITGRQKVHVVPFMTEYIQRTAFENRCIFREDLSTNDFFEQYNNLLDRLKSIVSDEKMSDRKFSMEYFYNLRKYKLNRRGKKDMPFPIRLEVGRSARNNPRWFNQLVGMLTMVYGNAYLFSADDMADCLAFKDKKYLVRYQMKICNVLQEYMDKCFASIKLQDAWAERKWKENLEKHYEEPDRINKGFFELVYAVQNEMIQMSEEGEEAFSQGYYECPDIMSDKNISVERSADEKKSQMVELSLVLEIVFQHLEVDRHIETMDHIQELLMQCPSDVIEDLIRSLNTGSFDRETLKRLLADRIESVERAEYRWNNGGILFEVEHTLNVFEELFRFDSTKYRDLRWIAKELKVPEASETATLSKSSYRKLVSTLGWMLDKQDVNYDMNHYYLDDEKAMLEEAGLLFRSWDIGVDIYNVEAVRRAVHLGTEVALIGILQAAYLYQTIYERYTGNNSMSSKELETVGDKNTYYYNFFNQVVEILGDTKRDTNLRERIETVYTNERQKYVELLIARVRDE